MTAPLAEIRLHPSPILRTASMRVENTWTCRKEARELADQMLAVMHASPTPGVGLAAQQVGRLLRVMVWNATGLRSDDHALANAYIIARYGIAREQEACLSLPGVQRVKPRAQTVRIRGYDLFAKESVEITAHGFEARILQHETDHLDGFLFIDRREPKPSRKKVRT